MPTTPDPAFAGPRIPAWKVAVRDSSSSASIRLILPRLRVITEVNAPRSGSTPPTTLVPPPNGTTAIRSAAQKARISATSRVPVLFSLSGASFRGISISGGLVSASPGDAAPDAVRFSSAYARPSIVLAHVGQGIESFRRGTGRRQMRPITALSAP